MSRPKSDLVMTAFRLSPTHIEALDRIARSLGLVISAGRSRGEPDRSEALRMAIEELDMSTRQGQSQGEDGDHALPSPR